MLPRILLLAAIPVFVFSCGTAHKAGNAPLRAVMAAPEEEDVPDVDVRRTREGGGRESAIPAALIYRTSGNFDNNVSIPLNATRTAPLSFPDPRDVGPESAPVKLADGWLLDRRGGIGENTVFLKYTYPEYAALKTVPTVETLMKSIIPGARVTAAVALPVSINEADTATCNRLIREGLPGCRHIVETFTVTVPEQE